MSNLIVGAPRVGEFQPWPKIARLNRGMVITEKIDGTNAAIGVTEDGEVYAQSRTRLITPKDDNFNFAAWVETYKANLRDALGPGLHFGEWWGLGIQRGYGLTQRRFSLFNAARWTAARDNDPLWPSDLLSLVPVLYEGPFSTVTVDNAVELLRTVGSAAAPGFMKPEGIVVYHTAARVMFKVTLEGDDQPKGQP